MRLTLRTLLAYRDHVLKPAEIEDMHARVQQSVLASNLIKRIDALSQRTNLLAPPLMARVWAPMLIRLLSIWTTRWLAIKFRNWNAFAWSRMYNWLNLLSAINCSAMDSRPA